MIGDLRRRNEITRFDGFIRMIRGPVEIASVIQSAFG
jgi:hypothetical protein